MISRSIEIFDSGRSRYRTIDPDEFIERLKRLRAVDPMSSHYSRDYYRSNRMVFGGTKILLKLR